MKFIYTLCLCLLACVGASAQCDTSQFVKFTISVQTDSFPTENGWLLVANDNSVFYNVVPPGTYTEPLSTYKHEFCVPKNKCLRLFLTDTKGDGILPPGGVSIAINDNFVKLINYFEYAYFDYFNCAEGETCGTPATVAEGNHKTKFDNHFYLFTPTESGVHRISTCDSTNTCLDTKVWLYEECTSFNPSNSQSGAIAFNDDACGKLASLSQMVLEKDKPYIVRIGSDSCKAKPIKWSVNFLGKIPGCMDTSACNFNFLAGIPTNDCIPQNSPECKGPDLIVSSDAIERTMYLDEVNADEDPCLVNEGCLTGFGKRKVLRFDTQIRNIGDQDFYIGKPYGNPSQFVYDKCHQHFHYRGYAEYLLFDDAGNRIPVGFKAGFCVLDFQCEDSLNIKYSCLNMGLSAKCDDIYERELDCQWIDVTNIPAGKYTFVARVNWDNSPDKLGRMESRNDNNWAQTCIEIKRTADSVWFQLDTLNCPSYKDCKGVKYGNSTADCEGKCAGTAVAGDNNGSKTQDTQDVLLYTKQAVNLSGEVKPCTDLNDDGRISMTDAALLNSCINNGKRHTHIGSSSYHDHCRFPQKTINLKDTVYFKIQDYNPSAKYFDVAMRNPATHVNAFQMTFSGVDIAKVTSLVDSSKYPVRLSYGVVSRSIGGISLPDSTIKKSASYRPLFRVHFSNQATTKVEIKAVTDITDNEGYSAVGKGSSTSINISANNDVQLRDLDIQVIPNPIVNQSVLSFSNPEAAPFELSIMSASGQVLQRIKNITSEEVTIDGTFLPAGLYLYRLQGEAGFGAGKILVTK